MTIEWIKIVARGALALLLFCALLLTPVIISVTHGPGAAANALQTVAINAAHGHTHDWDEVGQSGQHDATDHEHNVAVVLSGGAQSIFELASAAFTSDLGIFAGLAGDGLRRPPRDSIV